MPVHTGLTEVDDVPCEAGERAFDLGLGAANARFIVAVRDTALAERLAARAGRSAVELLQEIGRDLAAAAPTRIVMSNGVSIRIAGPVPAPHGKTPEGPHTHLTPDDFGNDRMLADGLPLTASMHRLCGSISTSP